MAEYLRQQHFRDMICTVHDLGVWVRTTVVSNLGCVVLLIEGEAMGEGQRGWGEGLARAGMGRVDRKDGSGEGGGDNGEGEMGRGATGRGRLGEGNGEGEMGMQATRRWRWGGSKGEGEKKGQEEGGFHRWI